MFSSSTTEPSTIEGCGGRSKPLNYRRLRSRQPITQFYENLEEGGVSVRYEGIMKRRKHIAAQHYLSYDTSLIQYVVPVRTMNTYCFVDCEIFSIENPRIMVWNIAEEDPEVCFCHPKFETNKTSFLAPFSTDLSLPMPLLHLINLFQSSHTGHPLIKWRFLICFISFW